MPLTAGRARSDIENSDIQILGADLCKVFVAHISVYDRIILVRSLQNIIGAECSVSKTNVFCRWCIALAPTTRYVMALAHGKLT